jgi:hypothetical protein
VDDAPELYGLPLDRFVTERAALAKALRTAGHREQAAQTAKLAKPTVAAWVVNQLVRAEAEAVARLFDAGDAVKRAQQDLVAGRGGGPALRDASAVKRDALDELVEAARRLLKAQGYGHGEATLARAAATLDAAALEDDARAQVQGGCLTRELAHVGLGDGWATAEPAVRAQGRTAAKRAATAPRGKPERIAGGTGRRDTQSAQTRAREEAQADARRRQAAERARRELDQARTHREEVARELHEARRRRDDAARGLDEARRRHDDAARAVEEAQRRLEDADEALGAAEQAVTAPIEAFANARAQPPATGRTRRR